MLLREDALIKLTHVLSRALFLFGVQSPDPCSRKCRDSYRISEKEMSDIGSDLLYLG